MTPPNRPTPIGTKIENVGTRVMLKLVGLVIFAGSGFFLYKEVLVPPSHTSHILIFAGIGVFGLMLAFPAATMGALKGMVGIASPYLGKFASRNNTTDTSNTAQTPKGD